MTKQPTDKPCSYVRSNMALKRFECHMSIELATDELRAVEQFIQQTIINTTNFYPLCYKLLKPNAKSHIISLYHSHNINTNIKCTAKIQTAN